MHVEQQQRVLDLVTDLPWADVEGAICCVEDALRLALEATEDAFPMWEAVAEDNGFDDEFSLGPSQVRDLSPEERLAYVARLVRTVMLNYGVDDRFGDRPSVREAPSWTPAGILHGLNDISWTPVTSDRDVP
jgi:hypothetical protein